MQIAQSEMESCHLHYLFTALLNFFQAVTADFDIHRDNPRAGCTNLGRNHGNDP